LWQPAAKLQVALNEVLSNIPDKDARRAGRRRARSGHRCLMPSG